MKEWQHWDRGKSDFVWVWDIYPWQQGFSENHHKSAYWQVSCLYIQRNSCAPPLTLLCLLNCFSDCEACCVLFHPCIFQLGSPELSSTLLRGRWQVKHASCHCNRLQSYDLYPTGQSLSLFSQTGTKACETILIMIYVLARMIKILKISLNV